MNNSILNNIINVQKENLQKSQTLLSKRYVKEQLEVAKIVQTTQSKELNDFLIFSNTNRLSLLQKEISVLEYKVKIQKESVEQVYFLTFLIYFILR